jgi:cytoskeleton protein RodZ
MESIGFKLRRARLSQDLTLGDINASTRIPVRILQAIESDQPERISGAAFYKSFVRQFAEEVKLDYQEIAAEVQAIVAAMTPEPHGAVVTTHYAPRSLAIRSFRSGRLHSGLTFASFVAVLAGCSYLYSAWQKSGATWNDVASNVESAITSAVGKSSASPDNEQTSSSPPDSRQSGRQSQNPTVVPNGAGKQGDFLIQLSALERTWLSIVADGKQAFAGFLERAQTKTLQGRDIARIRTGNAGAVSVVFNGKDLGPLGPRGQARVAVFTKHGYEVLKPPDHVAVAEIILTGE